ncbi:aminotransferase class IV [[Limnothrix rosea] IAM M-220]|uniref:aminotransferase class IV n=1 Tax=[Limnothrix rosea] IAM M-220 TaxID=454133 RepID=UPI0009600A25|nr:aminotransferase class IV [[Limnothrix rosea] IAM M-220]OKH17291.1 aminotransferase [[Limnothrix rosea] IAM M-220]
MGYWFAGHWFEGTDLTLSVTDPSFLFGATIFTTLRVFEGDLQSPLSHWPAHCDRLHNTIKQLNWPQPNWQAIKMGATKVAEFYPVVRITLLHDGRELIIGRQLPTELVTKQQRGIQAWLAADGIYRRSLADFKTGNYLGAWQALQGAIAQGAGEAILIGVHGDWLETATGNLWGFDGEQWCTPPAQGLLPGVMRAHLMSQLQHTGQSIVEIPWTSEHLKQFEAIAYSNSVVGVIPLTNIKNSSLPYVCDPDHAAVRALQKLSGYSKSL